MHNELTAWRRTEAYCHSQELQAPHPVWQGQLLEALAAA